MVKHGQVVGGELDAGRNWTLGGIGRWEELDVWKLQKEMGEIKCKVALKMQWRCVGSENGGLEEV